MEFKLLSSVISSTANKLQLYFRMFKACYSHVKFYSMTLIQHVEIENQIY